MRKRSDLMTVLSIYHFLVAALLLMAMCGVLLAIPFSTWPTRGYRMGVSPVVWLGLAGVLLAIDVAAFIVAGVGLLRMASWGRWVAIVLGVLSLPLFPLGTITGGLTLWYLLMPETRVLFEAAPAEAEEE